MEALLIINSLLVAISLYFVKDFHTDFKEVSKEVQGLKGKISELSSKVNNLGNRLKHHIKSVKNRFDKVDKD